MRNPRIRPQHVGVLTPNREDRPALPAKRPLRVVDEFDPNVLIIERGGQYVSAELEQLHYRGITVLYVPPYSTSCRHLRRRR